MIRRPQIVLICAAAVMATTSAHADFDRAAPRVDAATNGFAIAEERRLAAAATNEVAPLTALVEFYMAHELWVEALVALRRFATPTAATDAFAAECDFRLGRDEAVILRLAGRDGASPFLPMALARIGAFAEARAAFEKADAGLAPATLKQEYQLTRAEAFADENADAADDALRRAGAVADSARRDFISARILATRGDRQRSSAMMRRAAGDAMIDASGGYAMRAAIALAVAESDMAALDALALRWRGGGFDRDLELAVGRLRLADGDYRRGFRALAALVDAHPRSDAAFAAQEEIAGALPNLLADRRQRPEAAAEVFFENVEFAPPGREGDALIRMATTKLEALGLYEQAAQILDHQVFKRLRAAERATTAADLAALYLKANKPGEALRTLRSTRIAGLATPVAERRRQLEAHALSASGNGEGAVALLASAPTVDDLLLRGDINWSRKAWSAAATDYASYVAGVAALDDRRAREAAVRGATAFLLAGDRAGYRAFSNEALAKLEGMPEGELVAALGDVDRERFLERFMASYKSVYGPTKS